MDLEKFCGRKIVLDLLKSRVLDLKEGYRQNVALLGYPYVGKTTLLQKFLTDLDDPAIIPVYLDLENQDFGYFYHKVVASLLYHFAKRHQLSTQEEIPLLLESVREHLPQTVKVVKRIQVLVAQHKRSEAYREIVSLPQIFAQEANVFCVLVFDEFHELENLAVAEVFKILGAKIMTQRRCLYVVASSVPSVAEGILSEKMSLLFGNFEKLTVESFDSKTSQEFISQQLPDLRMGQDLQYFLIDFAGGQPLALQLFCEEIERLATLHHQAEIFLPLLSQAIENVIFHPWGVLSRHFELLLHQLNPAKSNVPVLSILQSLAIGRKKIKELALECGLQQTTVSQRMTKLLEVGVVLKNGNFYYLKDKLFRYWLRYVFHRRQKAIELDSLRSRELFQEDLSQAFDHFIASAKKQLPDRIVDLLSCFEKESLQINGRRYELPLFQNISSVPGEAGVSNLDLIRAATIDGEWLVALKAGTICENDITTIVDESRRTGQRTQRCILISMQDLDENTRVRALQEKMWIWSEGELCTLLNLFDKPSIIPSAL